MHQGRLLIGCSLLAKYFHFESNKVDVAFLLDHNLEQSVVQKNVQVGVRRTVKTLTDWVDDEDREDLGHPDPNEVQVNGDNVGQDLKYIFGWIFQGEIFWVKFTPG